MKKSKHINESIPVTITNVKENRKTAKKKGGNELCVETMIMLDIFISLYNEESLRSSNKLVSFFKD
jgi:cellulose synthase/poly-beta-1,6-N-acetylglucosamine synthase-like glycosyltransferase